MYFGCIHTYNKIMYRYNWSQSDADIDITLCGQNLVSFHISYTCLLHSFVILQVFCTENVILHIVDKAFEASIFLGNWCYNLNIGKQI